MPYKDPEKRRQAAKSRLENMDPDKKAAMYKADYTKKKQWYEDNKARREARRQERYATDPVFRQQRLDEGARLRVRSKEYSREIKRQYKLKTEDVERMVLEQKNLCAICEKHMERPCVDHCHETGLVRAMLCTLCNSGIGYLQDDISTVRRALQYLRKYNKEIPTGKGEPFPTLHYRIWKKAIKRK